MKKLNNVLVDHKNLVVQELLNNPFLVDKRKINLRVYFLITCQDNDTRGYIHTNGFMYYTAAHFNYDSVNNAAHITTGYIDRSVYEKNPLTIEEFYKYLDKNGYNSELLKSNIKGLFGNIMGAVKAPLCNNKKLKKSMRFQIFGADVAPDNTLNVKLIEINKGPDLGSKSARDNAIKQEVVKDIFDIVGLVKKKTDNKFIRVM